MYAFVHSHVSLSLCLSVSLSLSVSVSLSLSLSLSLLILHLGGKEERDPVHVGVRVQRNRPRQHRRQVVPPREGQEVSKRRLRRSTRGGGEDDQMVAHVPEADTAGDAEKARGLDVRRVGHRRRTPVEPLFEKLRVDRGELASPGERHNDSHHPRRDAAPGIHP